MARRKLTLPALMSDKKYSGLVLGYLMEVIGDQELETQELHQNEMKGMIGLHIAVYGTFTGEIPEPQDIEVGLAELISWWAQEDVGFSEALAAMAVACDHIRSNWPAGKDKAPLVVNITKLVVGDGQVTEAEKKLIAFVGEALGIDAATAGRASRLMAG